uniref:Uncharacterized protein n=1 Tax=Anopheles farauti TaxID=69004 RepID=A0A182Q566_9DIPT
MAESSIILKAKENTTTLQNRPPEQDTVTGTSENNAESGANYYHELCFSLAAEDSHNDDDDGEEDPYKELFMNAYRSVPNSDDEDEPANGLLQYYSPDEKPLSLMEDWDLWDYMDEIELQERLRQHPLLFEEITRKRKRPMLEEEEESATAASIDDELSDVMSRAVKCIRTESGPSLTS